MINLYLGDSLAAMRAMDENTYDLAIVDPPYGLNRDGQNQIIFKTKKQKHRKYHKRKNWDNEIPPPEYFTELRRVSRNQIIWGGNYFVQNLIGSMGWIVWDKCQHGLTMSDCELAYSSYQRATRIWKCNRGILALEGTIHPTQKPVALYQWLLDNYAQPGDRILDTHLGSGSIAIACHNAGYALDAWEIDPEYHANAVARLNKHTRQLRLF